MNKRHDTMKIDLSGSDVSVVVMRYHDLIGYYLGVYLSRTDGLSKSCTGIIGKP